MVIGRGLFLSLFGETPRRQGGDLKVISKILCEACGISFYGPRKSNKGADTELIYKFCWSQVGLGRSNAYRFMKHIL